MWKAVWGAGRYMSLYHYRAQNPESGPPQLRGEFEDCSLSPL
jgi:hypothetical protein